MLNANNLVDIFEFLNYQDIYSCLKANRLWNEIVKSCDSIWKYIFLNYLYQKYLRFLTHPNQTDNDFIVYYYYQDSVHQMVYKDLLKTLSASNYRDMMLETVAVVNSFVSYYLYPHTQVGPNKLRFYPEHILSRGQRELRNRAGHISHILKDPNNGNQLLLLISGYTNRYQDLPTIDIVDFTNRSVLKSDVVPSHFSIPVGWFQCSVVLNNRIYLFGGHCPNERGTADEMFIYELVLLSDYDISSRRLKIVGASLDVKNLVAATVVVDPIPITTKTSSTTSSALTHRCIFFGGQNKELNQYSDEVYELFFIDDALVDTVQFRKVECKGDIPCPRAFHSAHLIGRDMYMFGGWSNLEQTNHYFLYSTNFIRVRKELFLNDLYVLNIDTWIWKRITTFGIPPSHRSQVAMFSLPSLSTAKWRGDEKLSLFSPKNAFESSRYLIIYGGATLDVKVRYFRITPLRRLRYFISFCIFCIASN
jgi:hypothetical protein